MTKKKVRKKKINRNQIKKNNQVLFENLKAYIKNYCEKFSYDLMNTQYSIEFGLVPNDYDGASKSVAVAKPPKAGQNEFKIILNPNYFSNKSNYDKSIESVVHEFTHIQDMIHYKKITNEKDYINLRDTRKYLMFQMWTEFNAYSKSHYFVIDTFYDKNTLNEKAYEEVVYISETATKLINNSPNQMGQLYNIFCFMGYIYSWNMMVPEIFDNEFIGKIFNHEQRLINVYNFLKTHTMLENAHEDFDELRSMLGEIYKGIY